MVVLIGTFLTNSIFYYGLLCNSEIEMTELIDFGDKESEKEEEKKEENKDNKIPIISNYGKSKSFILLAKAQSTLRSETLHHPEILTPPPEFFA